MKLFFKLFLFIVIINSSNCFSQGLNHNFLIGYTIGLDTNVISKRGILSFTNTSLSVSPDSYAMPFSGGAQANISDEQGNLLMYTNGCWIADATGNMMQNGDSLNPGLFADDWCDAVSGLPITNTSVFLPWPGDSTRYILFHQTSTDNNSSISSELFYSVIDMTLNGGLGAVTQKNVIALQTTLCPAIGACKHANGRDWWIVVMDPYSNTIYKLLLTPSGIINMPFQSSGLPSPNTFYGTVQFSPDGHKFAYYIKYFTGSILNHELRILNFDRCNGMFSNPSLVNFTAQIGGQCTTSSSNSKYIYYGTYNTLFQVNTDTTNIAVSLDTIAVRDNYCYPYSSNCPDFWYGYLAANGKIYIGSGGTTIDFHYINQPDSDGIACDMHLHGLRLPCRVARSNVYHPNYYLGPKLGSACDTLAHVGIYELSQVKNVTLQPNPSHNGNFQVSYLLPQNKSGKLFIHDLMGKQVYEMNLPPWSTMQDLFLPELNGGVYVITIHSENARVGKRLVIVK